MKKLVIVDKSIAPYRHLSGVVEIHHQREIPNSYRDGADLLAVAFPGSVWGPTKPYGKLERAVELAHKKEIPLFIISPNHETIPGDFIGAKDPQELYEKVRDSLG